MGKQPAVLPRLRGNVTLEAEGWNAEMSESHGREHPMSAASPARTVAERMRRIRADDLLYLLAVARTGRRRTAASHLGVDHTTVSRRVRALEKSVGARLLQRGSDGWQLTELGRKVAERAAPIEVALQGAAEAALGTTDNALRGTVRVTAPDGFGAMFVAPALADLRLRHPNLTVELITATRQFNLHQSGFDVAIAVGSTVNSRLVCEPVTDYVLGLYASSQYLLKHGTPSTTEAAADHPLIFFVDSLLQVGDLDLSRHLPGLNAKFMSTNIFAHVAATRAGGGIGLLPAFLAIRYPDLRRVLADTIEVRLNFSLATRRQNLTNPAVRAVRDAIQNEAFKRRGELCPT